MKNFLVLFLMSILFGCQNEQMIQPLKGIQEDLDISAFLNLIEELTASDESDIDKLQILFESITVIEKQHQLSSNERLIHYLELEIDQIVSSANMTAQRRADKTFSTHDTIPFSAEEIWSVLSSPEEYSSWNPFTIDVETTFEIGSPIIMTVRLLPFLTIVQPETIEVYNPYSEMCWSSELISETVFSSYRCRALNQVDVNTTIYSNTMVYDGLLAPVVNAITRPLVFHGFTQESKGLKQYLQD